MKTQAKWEDRRKEKMMFEDYKLSQEALEHNATVSLCFPGGTRDSVSAFIFSFNPGGMEQCDFRWPPRREKQRKVHCTKSWLWSQDPCLVKEETWGSEELFYFPKVTQLVSYKAGIWALVCLVSKPIPLNNIIGSFINHTTTTRWLYSLPWRNCANSVSSLEVT